MYRLIITIIINLTMWLSLHSQVTHPIFNQSVELKPNFQIEVGSNLCLDEGGNIYVVGKTNTLSNLQLDSLVILKMNAKGEYQWVETMALGNLQNEVLGNLIYTDDGNLLIGGTIQDYDSFNIKPFLLKLSTEGETLWYQEYGDNVYDQRLTQLTQVSDGGYLAGYNTNETDIDYQNAWIFKTDSVGTLEWELIIESDIYSEVAGLFEENQQFIVLLKDTDTNSENFQAALYKYYISYEGVIDSIEGPYFEPDKYVVFDSFKHQGGFVTVGMKSETPFSNGFNGFVYKIDSLGEFEWELVVHNGIGQQEWFENGTVLPDGSIVVCGATFNNNPINPENSFRGWLAKISPNGELLWQKIITFDDQNVGEYFREIELSPDGGLVIVGETRRVPEQPPSILRNNMWMLKIDTAGNDYAPMTIMGFEDEIICINDSISLTATSYSGRLCPYSNGENCEKNFWWEGSFLSNNLADTIIFIPQEPGEYPITYTIVDALGDTASLTANITVLPNLTLPNNDTLFVNETFEITTEFEIDLASFSGSASPYLNETNGQLIFESPVLGTYELIFHEGCGDEQVMQIVVQEPTGIQGLSVSFVEVYPNPAQDIAYFRFPSLEKPSELQLYNPLGQLVKKVNLPSSTTKHRLDLQALPSGIYLWELGTQSGKLLKE